MKIFVEERECQQNRMYYLESFDLVCGDSGSSSRKSDVHMAQLERTAALAENQGCRTTRVTQAGIKR